MEQQQIFQIVIKEKLNKEKFAQEPQCEFEGGKMNEVYWKGWSDAEERIKKLIDEIRGEEYTDLEIWEEMKKDLKARIEGEK